MATKERRNIQTRQQLFDFLQSQMQTAYRSLREEQRLESESSLIKSYIFEVDLPATLNGSQEKQGHLKGFLEELFRPPSLKEAWLNVYPKEDEGFFEVNLKHREQDLTLYLDTITNPRFWLGFSVSHSAMLDRWFEAIPQARSELDFVWLWPAFLERVQSRGAPRGFGLDYDYRRFEDGDGETTTYLKMQLWGSSETQKLYGLLRRDPTFQDKVVLSKVRLKESGDSKNDDEAFALQDVKYTGKFTTRGTDFSTHAATLSFVRSEYEKRIRGIEDTYALRWKEAEQGGVVLEGFAIHFIPTGAELPVKKFCERVLDGTAPFRLLGFPRMLGDSFAVMEVIDLHTGGELSFEIYPDILSVYLPEGTCGNSIARLYTNLQHFFNIRFTVEADNGDKLF
ncbi:MAG: hypothetical protein IT330_06770 [Anaerolineae bacterium]|nr:hypothetical protein [Anaerolineae bacterium]